MLAWGLSPGGGGVAFSILTRRAELLGVALDYLEPEAVLATHPQLPLPPVHHTEREKMIFPGLTLNSSCVAQGDLFILV